MLGRCLLVLLAASAVQGLNENCNAGARGVGTCISTSDCQGLSSPGFCPGPANIQCCTFPTCTITGATPVAGVCKKTSFCNSGPRAGFCPGPANVQCCPGGSVPNPEPPGPNPEPPGPNPEPPGPEPEPPGPNPEPPGPDPEPPGPNPEPPGPNPEPPGPNPPDPVPGPMVPIPPIPTDDSCTVGSVTGYCVDTFFCKGTVTSGACPNRPSNVKCCTAQPDANAVAGMDEYLPALAVQWGAKASVNPYRVFEWLRRDLAETLQGGQARFGRNYPGDASVGRSWLIGRQEQMWFRHNNPGRSLGSFSPPSGTPRMTSTEIDGAGENAKVTQLLIDFARALKPLWPGVHLGTYAGHGGGSFNDAGYSTDLTIPGRDDRGFFRHADAVAFCKKVHEACQTVGCDWRIIYNDFRVADEVNRFFGFQHNIFVGSARVTNGRATNLNWHGPLVLHLHLDIVPKAAPQQTTSLSPATIPDDTRTVPLPPPPPPAGTGVPCQLPNNGPRGVCKNWRECDGTTTTGLCPGNSDIRCCTPRTFVETSSNTQRLPSRLRSIPKPAASDVSEKQDEHHRAENVLQP